MAKWIENTRINLTKRHFLFLKRYYFARIAGFTELAAKL